MQSTLVMRVVFGLILIAPFVARHANADSRRGERFAEHWCSACHGVKPSQGSPKPGAPSFSQLAADPSVSAASLRDFLMTTPHMAMPKLKLRPQDMDNVVGYILSLRRG